MASISSLDPALHHGDWICEVESWSSKVEAKVKVMPRIPVEVSMEGVFGQVRIELGRRIRDNMHELRNANQVDLGGK